MTSKYRVLYKWKLENGITLMPDTIIDVVSYGDEAVCIGHPSFSQVIWVKREEFDSNCLSMEFR